MNYSAQNHGDGLCVSGDKVRQLVACLARPFPPSIFHHQDPMMTYVTEIGLKNIRGCRSQVAQCWIGRLCVAVQLLLPASSSTHLGGWEHVSAEQMEDPMS